VEVAQQFIEIFKSMNTKQRPPSHAPTQSVTIQDLEKLILKLLGTKSDNVNEVCLAPRPDSLEDTQLKVVARTSLLAFKEVNEVYAHNSTYL